MNLVCYILLLIFLTQVFTKPPNDRNSSKQISKQNSAPTILHNGHIRNAVQPKLMLRKIHKANKSMKSKSGRSRASVSKKRVRKKSRVNMKSVPKIVEPNTAKQQRFRKKFNRKRRMKARRIKTAKDVMPQDAALSEKGAQTNKNVNSRPLLSRKKIKRKRLLRKVKRKRVKSSKKRRKKTRNGKPRLESHKSHKEKSSNDVLQDQNISTKEQINVESNNTQDALKQKDQLLIKTDKISSTVASNIQDEKRKNEKITEQLPKGIAQNDTISNEVPANVKSDLEQSMKEVDHGLHKIDQALSTIAPQTKDEKIRNEHFATQTTKANLIVTTEKSSTKIFQEMKSESTTAKFGSSNLLISYFQRPRTTTPKTFDPDIADLQKIEEEYEQNVTKFVNYYLSHKRPPRPTTTLSPMEIAEFEAKGFMKPKKYSFPTPNLCAKHYAMVKRWRAENRNIIARYPDCTRDGLYERTQCALFDRCVCVDPPTGNIVPGNCWKPSKYEQKEIERREREERAEKKHQETIAILKYTCDFSGDTSGKCKRAIFNDVVAANPDIPRRIIKEYKGQTNSMDKTVGRSRREMEQTAMEILNDVQHESRQCRYIIDRFPFLEPHLHRHAESCKRNFYRYMNAKWHTPFDWKAKALASLDRDQ